MPKQMRTSERTIYQIVDGRNQYRSSIMVQGRPLDFISKDREEAIIYTYDEALKIAEYYIDKRNIPVEIEARIEYSYPKKQKLC